MSALPKITSAMMTPEEYLAFERTSEIRHEYIDGEIYAMSGASARHDDIFGNLFTDLRARLKSRPCKIYSSNLRVGLPAGQRYFYPDLSIVCGEPTFADTGLETLTNPIALIEILSPTTANYDRGDKFIYYQQIPTLREYLLIAQHQPRLDHFRRVDDPPNAWLLQTYQTLDTTCHLPALDCTLTLADIYAGVTFDTPTESEHPQ